MNLARIKAMFSINCLFVKYLTKYCMRKSSLRAKGMTGINPYLIQIPLECLSFIVNRLKSFPAYMISQKVLSLHPSNDSYMSKLSRNAIIGYPAGIITGINNGLPEGRPFMAGMAIDWSHIRWGYDNDRRHRLGSDKYDWRMALDSIGLCLCTIYSNHQP